MAIELTDAHRKRMIEQVQTGVLNLQDSVASNAATHKQWAISEMPLAELQEKITRTIDAYEAIRARLRKFRDVTIPADTQILAVGDKMSLTVQSLGVLGESVTAHIDAFDVMPKTTYEEIIAACDYLIANVNPAPSVWDD